MSKDLKKAGKAMVAAIGAAPFESTSDAELLEAQATDLVERRGAQDAHLGYVLTQLLETRRYLDVGFEKFGDYVEERLNFSQEKGRALIDGWAMFQELGLPLHILSEISWTKFLALRPAVRAGAIDASNIHAWLPKLATRGEHMRRAQDVKSEVKILLAEQTASSVRHPDSIEQVRLDVRTEDMDTFQRNLEVVRDQYGGGDGTVLSNLVAQAAANVMDEGTQSFKIGGLLNLKKTAEEMYPGIVSVFITPEGKDYTEENLGIIPAIYVFQAPDGEFILAVDAEDAKRGLGAKDVTRHTLLVSDAYRTGTLLEFSNSVPAASAFSGSEWTATLRSLAGQVKAEYPEVAQEYGAFVKSSGEGDAQEDFILRYNFLVDVADQQGISLSIR